MSSSTIQRPPLNPQERMVDTNGLPTQPFLIYERGIRTQLDAAPAGFDPVILTGQHAGIATTAFPTNGDLSAGLYRASWYVQVITPAGVSSSVQVTLSWALNAITQQFVGALNNGNLTTTREFNGVQLIAIDVATPITFAVAYASNPAAAMHYNLYLTLERLAGL